jgi:hypothetical protein
VTAIGEIHGVEEEVTEIGNDGPALVVEPVLTQGAAHDLEGLNPRVQGDTRVAFAFGGVQPGVPALGPQDRLVQLLR